jgi:hypothetical protein
MAGTFPNTELVFRDLKDIAVELQKERNSPLRVRRLLSQFITLSQQLTEVMRKEYSDQIGKEWQANKFSGWNEVTALFKKLRRTDYHSYPVTICVEETQYFAAGDIFEDGVGTSEVAVQGTWDLGDPFSEHIPDGLNLVLADPTTGRPSNKTIKPRRWHYVFKLNARTQELDQALQKVVTNDVHKLIEKSVVPGF